MKARELLSEYSLTMSDVELQASKKSLLCRERRQSLATSHAPSWVKLLFGGVRTGFGVEGFFSRVNDRRCIVFVGVEPDVSLASYTFDFLYRVGKSCPGMHKKKERQKNQWRMGFATALAGRLRAYQSNEQSKQEKALVPVKSKITESYIESKYPDLVKMAPVKKVRPTKAYQAGLEEGRRVQWGKPVGSNDNATPMLEQ
jgi:hypothetical protein